MTLSIELDAQSLAELNRQAAELGIRAEELAGKMLNRQLSKSNEMADSDFRAALEASFRENDEAYRRLAQ
jgi:hypothetical protein